MKQVIPDPEKISAKFTLASVHSVGLFIALSSFFYTGATNLIAAEPLELRLWSDDAPGALGDEPKDIPTLTVYLPDSTAKPSGVLVILPGGGYGHLAMDHEGHQIAEWAVSMGMAGAIVSYRHRNRGYGHPAPMLDAQRAIRTVRSKEEIWNIDPNKVGVIGFSAGGHLASTVLTRFEKHDAPIDEIDRLNCRPDFGILCYPVIAFGENFTHAGSQRNLLGKNPDKQLIESLSNEKQVKPNTPPCFVWHTVEDRAVKVENSLRFFGELAKLKNGSELHVFDKGRHGLGLAKGHPGAEQWPSLCKAWIERTILEREVGKL